MNDPMYIGLRQKRETSEKYDQLIDELICALRERFVPLLFVFHSAWGRYLLPTNLYYEGANRLHKHCLRLLLGDYEFTL